MNDQNLSIYVFMPETRLFKLSLLISNLTLFSYFFKQNTLRKNMKLKLYFLVWLDSNCCEKLTKINAFARVSKTKKIIRDPNFRQKMSEFNISSI